MTSTFLHFWCYGETINEPFPSPFRCIMCPFPQAVSEGKEEEEEEVNSPMFVPKVGKFFQHDTREGDEEQTQTK